MPPNVETIILRVLGESKSGEQTLSKMQKALSRFGAALTAVSDAALVTFAKLGEGGAAIEGLEIKFNRTMRSFGLNADEMISKWQVASRGVIAESELMAKANYLALTGIPVDELSWMLDAVQNAAQATGLSFELLFSKLTMGLARKSKPMLDDLGIILSATEAYEKYAVTVDKSVDSLTEAEKQLAFTAAARAAAARQEEVLGKVTETAATVIARSKAVIKDAGDQLKKAFIPVAVAAAKVVTFLGNAFKAIPEPVKKLFAQLAAGAAFIGAIIGPTLTIVGLLPIIKVALGAVLSLLVTVGPIVAAVAAMIGALILAVKVARRAWDENWGKIQDVVNWVKINVLFHLGEIMKNIRYWVGLIKSELRKIWSAIRGIVEPILERVRELLMDGVGILELLETVRDAVNVILSTITLLLLSLRLLLEGKSEQAFDPLRAALVNVLTLIVVVWRRYISKALTYGWNLVVNLANGIIRAARTVLVQAANFIGQMLASFLAPGSPPKKGPLRHIADWATGLINTYFRAFGKGDFSILDEVLAPVHDALQSAVDLEGLDKVEMLNIFKDVREQTAALIADFRETGRINEDIMAGISAKLGEGGAEYVKYMRLTLEHQKALGRLGRIQDLVAEKEAAGFIPAKLKARLEAAQAEADAKEDAVNWQQEYLAALQQGVDIQMEMLLAMQELTEAIKGGGEEKGGITEDTAVAGLVKPEDTEVDFAGFGGFSDIFTETRKEVEDWLDAFPAKFAAWWEATKLVIAQKGLEILQAVRTTLLQIGAILALKYLEIRGKIQQTLRMIWAIILFKVLEIRETIRMTLLRIVAILAWKFLEMRQKVQTIIRQILAILVFKLLEIRAAIQRKIREIIAGLLWWLLLIRQGIRQALLRILAGLLFWLLTIRQKILDIKERIRIIVLMIAAIVTGFLFRLYLKITMTIRQIDTWIRLKIAEVLLWLSGKITDISDAGRDLIGGFWDGIKEKWEELKIWFLGALKDLPQWAKDLLKIESPSQVFAEIGQQLAAGLHVGFDAELSQGRIQQAMGGLMDAGAPGGLGQNIVIIQFPGGLTLPGIQDGRDAEGFLKRLQDIADSASLRGAVPGGIME